MNNNNQQQEIHNNNNGYIAPRQIVFQQVKPAEVKHQTRKSPNKNSVIKKDKKTIKSGEMISSIKEMFNKLKEKKKVIKEFKILAEKHEIDQIVERKKLMAAYEDSQILEMQNEKLEKAVTGLKNANETGLAYQNKIAVQYISDLKIRRAGFLEELEEVEKARKQTLDNLERIDQLIESTAKEIDEFECSRLCQVCLEKPKEMVNTKCGHVYYCYDCYQKELEYHGKTKGFGNGNPRKTKGICPLCNTGRFADEYGNREDSGEMIRIRF